MARPRYKRRHFKVRKKTNSRNWKNDQRNKNPLTELTKIGGGSDIFLHDVAAATVYPWWEIAPLIDFQRINVKLKGKVSSLRTICVRVLAGNASDLTTKHLNHCSLLCVKSIWNYIVSCHNDSLGAFVSFASLLNDSGTFQCHYIPRDFEAGNILNYLQFQLWRYEYLYQCLLPKSRNHRIENIFNNIRFHDFALYLDSIKFSNSLFLDFSCCSKLLLRDDYFRLLKLHNLVGINLSNNSTIDNNILYNIANAVMEDRLCSLRIIRITNCPSVTEAGIKHLFSVNASKKLSLIITDSYTFTSNLGFHDKMQDPSVISAIDDTSWCLADKVLDNRVLNNKDNKSLDNVTLLKKFPLPLCLSVLQKQFNNIIPNNDCDELNAKTILLDFMFHEISYTPGSIEPLLLTIHFNRMKSRNQPISGISCFINNKNFEPPSTKHKALNTLNTNHQEPVSVFTRANKSHIKTSTKSNIPVKKPIKNVNKFFDM